MSSERAQVPGEIWPGVETLISGIDAALAGDPEPTPTALRQAWQQAVHLTPDLDVLRAMSSLLSRAGAQRLAAAPPDPNRAHRLAAFLARSELELVRARLAYGHQQMTHLEELTQKSPTVAMTLLTGKTGQAQGSTGSGSPRRAGDVSRCTPTRRASDEHTDGGGDVPPVRAALAGSRHALHRGRVPAGRVVPSAGIRRRHRHAHARAGGQRVTRLGVLALLGPVEAHGGYILQRPNNMAMWGASWPQRSSGTPSRRSLPS